MLPSPLRPHRSILATSSIASTSSPQTGRVGGMPRKSKASSSGSSAQVWAQHGPILKQLMPSQTWQHCWATACTIQHGFPPVTTFNSWAIMLRVASKKISYSRGLLASLLAGDIFQCGLVLTSCLAFSIVKKDVSEFMVYSAALSVLSVVESGMLLLSREFACREGMYSAVPRAAISHYEDRLRSL